MTHSPPRSSATSLEHYEQVSLYESAFRTRRDDVAFYVQLADRLGGPILEFGAGAGRVTLPLARRGHDVTAVDASEPMLHRLRDRLGHAPIDVRRRVEVKKADVRRFSSNKRYLVVLATFNIVGHLNTYRDLGRMLGRASRHLEKGGTLAFDVPIPRADELECDPEELFPAPRFKHPDTGAWIRQTERFEYDPGRQLLLVESQFREESGRDTLTVPLILRQWFPKEIEAALRYEGFRHVATFADFTPEPGLMANDTLVFVASKAKATFGRPGATAMFPTWPATTTPNSE